MAKTEVGWQPIERQKVEIRAVSSQDADRLNVWVMLTQLPPAEWVSFFLDPVEVPISPSMRPPEIQGQTIYLEPPDKEVKRYVEHTDARIEAANGQYQKDVVPRLRAELEQAERERAERIKRLEQARRDLDDL